MRDNPGVRRRDKSTCARQLVHQFTLTIEKILISNLELYPIVDTV